MERRLRKRQSLFSEKAVGILDCDSRIVDQDANRKREAAESHGVDGLTEEEKNDERRKDGEWDRDHDHQRRPPGTEKKHDHQGGQARRDRALFEQPLYRRPYEDGLIEKLLDLHARRRGRAGDGQSLPDAIDDGQSRSIAVLDDAQQD
jgi:hypothetical protein